MHLTYHDGAARPDRRDVSVTVAHPDATVADLAAALGAPGPDLDIDGRVTTGDVPLHASGAVCGGTLRSAPADPGQPGAVRAAPAGAVEARRAGSAGTLMGRLAPAAAAAVADTVEKPAGVVEVRVVGGLAAGAAVPLGPGPAVVGRRPDAQVCVRDPAVSRDHCRLEVGAAGQVSVTDLASRNGTDVNGERLDGPRPVGPNDLICLGGAVLLRVVPAVRRDPVVPVDAVREARASGTIPWTRAPRPVRVPDSTVHPLPHRPRGRTGPTFSVSMLLGPLVMAGAMIFISGDPRYALIAGLTPVMMLANLVEQHTRGRRSMRRGVREFRAELDRLAVLLGQRRDAELRRRRETLPDTAELLAWAHGPGMRLWERRPGAPDFLEVSAGTADLPWIPPVPANEVATADPDTAEVLARVGVLPAAPVAVTLSAGQVIGLRGDRAAMLAVTRSLLCQAAVTTGPADLAVAVCVDADRAADWDWAKWLPHTVDWPGGGGDRLLAAGAEASDALARSLLDPPVGTTADGDGPVLLVVVDGATLLEGRPCPLRELLAGRGRRVSGLVITDRPPALCTATVTVQPDGTAVAHRLAVGATVTGVLATGIGAGTARDFARALARFDDPELRVAGAGLPAQAALLPLLGMPGVTAAAVAQRWAASAGALRAGAVLGVSEHGVFAVDLDDDGPHGLIAGTTGSGKSELLRTLVAGLATGNDPEHLTFALIDYKGGGALDECARFPHSVGLVTDLDQQLGARALRCLQAELRRREHLLRRVGLSHVRDYQRLRDDERPDLPAMPRLVVVIDEFATLVRALPDFVDSLVGVAQLGRSLGIHLIMATQRPAGSVNEAIKNNVKLRIALRLESTSDSQDVIDHPAAAGIGGRQWGRAYYRVSAREVQPVQTALSTAVSIGAEESAPVTVAPFVFAVPEGSTPSGPTAPSDHPAPDGTAGGGAEVPGDGSRAAPPTDLQRLVAAARAAFEESGMAPPRPPWPDPLPPTVPAGSLPPVAERGLQTDTTGLPTLALADDPDRQTRYPVGWDPAAGNLLLYGVVGAGTSTALATLALSAARRRAPTDLHVYVVDMAAGDLAPLADLPHTGAYVSAAEHERQVRLIRLLRTELNARKAAGATGQDRPRPNWLTVIDNLPALLVEHDKDAAGQALTADLSRVYADGPAVGLHIAASADRPGGIPGPWAALTQQKLLMRLADAGDYGHFDVPRAAVPAFVPGRAIVATTQQIVQIAWPGTDLAAATTATTATWPDSPRTARTIGVLPTRIAWPDLATTATLTTDPAWIPIGLGDDTLAPVGIQLYEHEHALICGPPRSGRSTTLLTVATAVRAAAPDLPLIALAPRRSPLRDDPALTETLNDPTLLPKTLSRYDNQPFLLLIDDAETVTDGTPVQDLIKSRRPDVRIIAAGRTDTLRRAYGHWTQTVRESRSGILLIPDPDLDGDLFAVALPRHRRPTPVPGRGYLTADGTVTALQVAMPGRT